MNLMFCRLKRYHCDVKSDYYTMMFTYRDIKFVRGGFLFCFIISLLLKNKMYNFMHLFFNFTYSRV